MTMYARSDIRQVNVAEAHGGCGQIHDRPADGAGEPVQPWGLSCGGGCEDFLRGDQHWSAILADLPETFDEAKARESFEKRGARDRDALLALAMARMAGVSQAEIPPSVAKMLTGMPAHVPGVTVCPAGHDNSPGSRYCRECGTAMSGRAPAGALTSAAA